MAKRAQSNLSGDLGELDVIRKFFEIGAAVNSLAQSDYGWDAHVHTPTEAHKIGELPSSWDMSGLTAHVQIKNSMSGSTADVNVGTLRGWVAGSQVGTPTFFFLIYKGVPRYSSPKWLRKYLADADAQDKKDTDDKPFGKRMTFEVDFDTFGGLLRLWTRHSRVLIHEHVSVDDWAQKNARQMKDLEKIFISQVALAWLQAHQPDHYVPRVGEQLPIVLPIIYAGWQELGHPESLRLSPKQFCTEYSPEFLAFAEKTMGFVLEVARKSDPWKWPQASLATSYALATDMKSSLDEAMTLVRDVMAYYNLCLERARKCPPSPPSKTVTPWRGRSRAPQRPRRRGRSLEFTDSGHNG
ncbi:hypothetical protein [Arthrobacter sp. MW3 TE3886]|uniref:hypothetical protein n=1 Tax=Arthrobacter sp. MW3 TE3886 TaxID=3156254 RepID=UPI003515AD14